LPSPKRWSRESSPMKSARPSSDKRRDRRAADHSPVRGDRFSIRSETLPDSCLPKGGKVQHQRGLGGAALGPQLAGKPGESEGSEETRNRRSAGLSATSPLVEYPPQSVLKIASPSRGSWVRIPALPPSASGSPGPSARSPSGGAAWGPYSAGSRRDTRSCAGFRYGAFQRDGAAIRARTREGGRPCDIDREDR
jgi:hypothetical protein